MPGRVYTLKDENMTVGTGLVLAVVRTAADGVTAGGMLEILRLEISQSGTATAQQIRGEFFTRDTAGTLTTTATTPKPLSPLLGPASAFSGNIAPAGAAARSGTNSSADSGGTYVQHVPFNFNNLNGYLWIGTPDDRIYFPPATVCGVRLLASPTTTSGWTVNLVFREDV